MKKINPQKPKNKESSKIIAIHKKRGKVLEQVNNRFFKIVESKFYIRLKNRFIPNITEFLIKLGSSMVWAFMLMLSLVLFNIIPFTWYSFIGSLALYFIIEELRAHHIKINRIRRSKS